MNSPPWYPGANAGISFGNTAPANPVRGHMWWNGSVLALFDGAAWVDTNGGVIVPPSGGGGGGTGGTGAATVIISSTPPGNPVAGMQWWNGSVLQVFDGTQWKIVGPGGAAGPVPTTTRVFAVTQSTNVTLTQNAWTIVPFTNAPSLDSALGWNATTHMYQPTRAGTYLFICRSFMGTGTSGGWLQLNLFKNDQGTVNNSVQTVSQSSIYSPNPINEWMGPMGIALMNGNTDFVRLWAFNGGGSNDTNFYGGTIPNIEAYLLP
jgi:hypothetical protein